MVQTTVAQNAALDLVAKGTGGQVRGGCLFAYLEHKCSRAPVASFQGNKLDGIKQDTRNTIILHR